jgi:hypothetical protein
MDEQDGKKYSCPSCLSMFEFPPQPSAYRLAKRGQLVGAQKKGLAL